MFVGKARSLNIRHQTRIGRLAWDKHSSLLRKVVTYGRKKFYNIVTWMSGHVVELSKPVLKMERNVFLKVAARGQYCKTSLVSDLQIFAQSQIVCQIKLEKLARDKHSGLSRKFVTYGQKSFITLGPGERDRLRLGQFLIQTLDDATSLLSLSTHHSQLQQQYKLHDGFLQGILKGEVSLHH